MSEDLFSQNLDNPENPDTKEINAEIEKDMESEFYKKIKEKNKKSLIQLDFLERERIAKYIKDEYNKEKPKHDELCDKIDDWDDVFRMKNRPAPGADEDTPSYTSPLSTVTLETIHANIMNVFFTPKDVMRVLPTEAGDIPKIKKLDTFGNWSMENELHLFENCDQLFHSSDKNGECPYMVHWVKEYGTDIKVEIVMNPANPSEPLLDPVTNEPITQEKEVEKLLYNGPKLEIFSRKDYIRPSSAIRGKLNDWDMRIIRLNADTVNRWEKEGKFYTGTFDEIGGWDVEGEGQIEQQKTDKDGDDIPMGKTDKLFIQFFGRLRVSMITKDKKGDDAFSELEDEFIAVIEIFSETLCSLKKNKFPLKERPIGLDEFIPDDEGRKGGTGVIEFMSSAQNMYDALVNQFIFGTIQSNNPFGFFSPTGNQKDEPKKIRSGYLFPTANPQSINMVEIPPPNASLQIMMEEARNWTQLLFGISDYSAGIESRIDPSAPAKKAEVIMAAGSVRLNLIIKRKNRTLMDIFRRWFLLYQANMPPNKFMRIAGEDPDNPWKFEPVNMSDFNLKSIPDFSLVGNILNANKTLEAQKAIGIYQVLSQDPFFSPQTADGLQARHALVKFLLDKMDETGISNFLPSVNVKNLLTPEEENARFLQGDTVEPKDGEDHVYHIRLHGTQLTDITLPPQVRTMISEHVQKTVELMKKAITNQMVMARQGQQPGQNMPQGGMNAGQAQTAGAPGMPGGSIPQRPMGVPQGGVGPNV